MPVKRFVASVLIEIDADFDDFVYAQDDATVIRNLVHADMKVKSGEYENLLMGVITKVERNN